MEDWSYAAGWETSPEPIGVCKPKTYGGYAQDFEGGGSKDTEGEN